MSEPFLSEIKLIGFNFPPRGWAFCDGQILPINQNQSLYSLLGTTFGGDGRTSFALPDLRGRVPVHPGDGVLQGQKFGSETHALSEAEMAPHKHTPNQLASGDTANSTDPDGARFATTAGGRRPLTPYENDGLAPTPMNDAALTNAGGGQAHNNMQPSLVVNFCIALSGLFPSRN